MTYVMSVAKRCRHETAGYKPADPFPPTGKDACVPPAAPSRAARRSAAEPPAARLAGARRAALREPPLDGGR
jgi:hypothetical protein